MLGCSLNRGVHLTDGHSSTARDIVRSRESCTLKHNNATDARGRPRQLTGADAHAIVDYLDHCEFEKKAETWQDIQN